MTMFDEVLEFVLFWEGGISDDSTDPGGLTKFGISQRAYPDVDIRSLTREQALEIYRRDYWNPLGLDDATFAEALSRMDFAVHSGVRRSQEFWDLAGHDVLVFNQDRLHFLSGLEGFRTYGRGWTRRVLAVMTQVDRSTTRLPVDLVQIYTDDKTVEFHPEATSLGRTRAGARKIMCRVS